MKYQPYRGYGRGKPWYWYRRFRSRGGAPRRVRTKGDWRWNVLPPRCEDAWDWARRPNAHGTITHCRWCGKNHCSGCDCYTPWDKLVCTGGSTYRKQLAHRTFRRWARDAIRRELAGDDSVSHAFRYCGDWLD